VICEGTKKQVIMKLTLPLVDLIIGGELKDQDAPPTFKRQSDLILYMLYMKTLSFNSLFSKLISFKLIDNQ
jgi:hypothetical protein